MTTTTTTQAAWAGTHVAVQQAPAGNANPDATWAAG